MDKICRSIGILTGKNTLEHLYTIKDFPVFMGCVDSPASEDLKSDMIWDICTYTGLIQLRNLIPLETLYLDQHNDGTGKVWNDHYEAFSKFIYKYKPQHVLEIGGAHDFIGGRYLKLDLKAKWTIVEPNPQHIDNPVIKVIKAWFDDKFEIDEEIDTVVHSHVFEHMYNPFEFIAHVGHFLKKGDKHIFTFPNLKPMLERKFTNCLNFEHTVFITEYFTDYILQKQGFKILEKEYYGDLHSIFYATEKVEIPETWPELDNKYDEYKKIFMDFINYHLEMVADLNHKIDQASDPVYLFGGHIFSQYLIKFGLNTDNIVMILDNSPMKQGHRLYGTNLIVQSPKILKDIGPVNIILKAGWYNKEISEDINNNINNQVTFW